MLEEAKNLSKNIINLNETNQEAWIVYLTYAKIKNKKSIINDFKKKKYKKEMTLLNFIFEVVQASQVNILEKNQNINFMIFYLSIACLFNSNFDEAHFFLGQIYQTIKNYEKSIFFFKKIKVNHYLFLESQKNIAINKSKNLSFANAENHLLNLSILNLKVNLYNLTLADFYRIEKKYNKAIKFYSKIIDSNNYDNLQLWKIFYFRGICYERTFKWNLAEKDLITSLEINSENPDVLNYLAYGWLERDIKIDKALSMLLKAYKIDSDSYYILDSLAWAYYKKKNLIKASQLMEKAIILAPGEIVSLDHLGDIYFAMNRKREAFYLWKQVLDLIHSDRTIHESVTNKLKGFYEG